MLHRGPDVSLEVGWLQVHHQSVAVRYEYEGVRVDCCWEKSKTEFELDMIRLCDILLRGIGYYWVRFITISITIKGLDAFLF